MYVMKKISNFWHRLWFQEYDPLPAALFRISLGTLMTVYFLCLFPNWFNYYDASGYLSLELNSPDPGYNANPFWTVFYWTEGYVPILVYWFIGFFSSITFTIGYFTRTSTVLLYILISSLIGRNNFVVNGEDFIFRMTLLYSCFAPLGHTLSVDSLLRARKNIVLPKPLVWPIRCMQINIALIYVFSLPVKLLVEPTWLDGTAMYLVMMAEPWTRWPGASIFVNNFVPYIATYSAVFTEAAFAFLAWYRPTRTHVTLLIAAFHLLIPILLQNVVFFSLGMVASFWVFLPAHQIRKFHHSILNLLAAITGTWNRKRLLVHK